MPVLLAKNWAGSDPAGWWMSEKLDGVRAVWDCRQLRTRTGNVIHAPAWFLRDLPVGEPLDGELWLGRGRFQETVSVVQSHDAGPEWRQVRYAVFDAPMALGGFEDRLAAIGDALAGDGPAYVLPQRPCGGQDDLLEELARVEHQGGEGVMLRQPGSGYERRRTVSKNSSPLAMRSCRSGGRVMSSLQSRQLRLKPQLVGMWSQP